jgi:hypothetical protein
VAVAVVVTVMVVGAMVVTVAVVDKVTTWVCVTVVGWVIVAV